MKQKSREAAGQLIRVPTANPEQQGLKLCESFARGKELWVPTANPEQQGLKLDAWNHLTKCGWGPNS